MASRFARNGITALCEKLTMDEKNMNSFPMVFRSSMAANLTPPFAHVRKGRKVPPTPMSFFRFYEIPQKDLADKFSIYTNSQSAVKARDLHSNDKRIAKEIAIYG